MDVFQSPMYGTSQSIVCPSTAAASYNKVSIDAQEIRQRQFSFKEFYRYGKGEDDSLCLQSTCLALSLPLTATSRSQMRPMVLVKSLLELIGTRKNTSSRRNLKKYDISYTVSIHVYMYCICTYV